MAERKCYGRRTPKDGEPPDFYIGDEPIWVCLQCGGSGCLVDLGEKP